jgi:hypothetical protein
MVARIKHGAEAATLDQEMAALAADTSKLRANGGTAAVVTAAAFFHVRFENIHPLHDGNGRTGRVILAGQLFQGCGVAPQLFERFLVAHQAAYRQVFDTPSAEEAHFRLMNLVGTFLGLTPSRRMLPFSLQPISQTLGRPPSPKDLRSRSIAAGRPPP